MKKEYQFTRKMIETAGLSMSVSNAQKRKVFLLCDRETKYENIESALNSFRDQIDILLVANYNRLPIIWCRKNGVRHVVYKCEMSNNSFTRIENIRMLNMANKIIIISSKSSLPRYIKEKINKRKIESIYVC